MWEELIHHIYDLFYIAWWLLSSLAGLFSILLKPLTWAFSFGKGFINTAFKTPEELGLQLGPVGHFNASVFEFFNVIPHINLIFAGVGACIAIVFLVFVIKKLSAI